MTKAETNGDPLRIIYLEAENVKRLKAVRIKPDKTLVRIEGRNAQGKSSVLDAIAAALGGGKWKPDMPVRSGEKKAACRLDLGEIKVERRWTAAGGTVLEVTSADGQAMRSPQAILDELVGNLTFDPLEFTKMKPAEQDEVLRRLVGLDFSELDREREQLYAQRTLANREAKAAETRVGPMPSKPEGAPVNVRELADKQQAAIAHNRQCDDANAAAERATESRKEIEAQIAALNERLTSAHKTEAEAAERASGMHRQEVSDLGAAILQAEATNKAIRDREDWDRRSAEAKQKAEEAEALNRKIEEIDEKKQAALRGAKFPLDGLSLSPTGPTLNGIPFSQASAAEQLRTSVAIGLASKPRARIMLCRDGSLLDEANMQLLHSIAEEYDAQVFVERVAESKSESAVYIEDGEVVGQPIAEASK